VDHRDLGRERRVQDADRPVDHAERDEAFVDQAVPAQQYHPGVAPHQDAGPEGQQDDHKDERRHRFGAHQPQGDRIAQDQATQGDGYRGIEGDPEGLCEHHVLEQGGVVRERPVRIVQAAQQHRQHRQGVEHQHVDQQGCHEQQRDMPAPVQQQRPHGP